MVHAIASDQSRQRPLTTGFDCDMTQEQSGRIGAGIKGKHENRASCGGFSIARRHQRRRIEHDPGGEPRVFR